MSKAAVESIKPNIFEKLYFCFFVLLPFIYYNKLVDPVLIPRQAFLTVFVFIIGSFICQQVYVKKIVADFSFLKLPVFLFSFLFIVIILISFTRSIAITESWYVLSKVLIELLFFIITTFLIVRKKVRVIFLTKSVIVFTLIIIGISGFQTVKLFISKNDFFVGLAEINSTCGNKNLLSSLLFLTFPFLLYSVSEKAWKILSGVLVFCTLVIVWALQTKAVIVAFAAFFFMLFLLSFKYREQSANKRFKIIVAISIFLLLLIAGVFTFQNKAKFAHLFDTKSTFERIGLWENSFEMIKENFVWGVGAGNWQINFPKYGLEKFYSPEIKAGMTTFQRPHNDFLWVFCEMGCIGLLAYLAIFITAIYFLLRLVKKSQERELRFMYFTFLSTIAGYMLIAFLDFPLERIEHQVIILLMFSIISAHFYNKFRESNESKKIMVKLPLLLLFIFVPVFISSAVSVKRWLGEYHTQRLYYFHHQADWNQLIREADKTKNYFYSMDPMSAPIDWYKGVALFTSGNIKDAKISFEDAYLVNPYNIHVLNNLASCYESEKAHKQAEELYLKALVISPDFAEARLNLCAVYYNTQQFEKAFETIDKMDFYCFIPKYNTFMPVIVGSYMEQFLNKQKDPKVIQLIAEAKTSGDKVQLYKESKDFKFKLDEYLVEKAKRIVLK